jgi:glyoxylase-like metal-dependent hydrolase (beta-lactamase superfamily II)
MGITTEVFQIGGSGLSSQEDAAIYLVAFGGQAAVVDAGCGSATGRILKNIESCGVRPDQVEYLLLTHCHFDHTGGARALADALECKIVAHELDAEFLEAGNNGVTAARWYGRTITPFRVDLKISGAGKDIPLGDRIVEAIHVPGHSPGSLVYVTESDGQKVLFGQDIHGPLDSELLSNRRDYMASLKQLLTLEADILCEGHFGVYQGKQTVRDFIQSYLR